MKLREPPAENSFYESFSDLIFGTLVLFLVLVMALALQLRQARKAARTAESAANLVYEERVSGSSADTRLIITHVPRNGVLNVAVIPEAVQTWWSTPWQPDRADEDPMTYPLQVLCSFYLENGDDIFIPIDRFVELGSGMTRALGTRLIGDPRIGLVLFLLDHVVRQDPKRAWTAASLAEAVGGIELHPRPGAWSGPSRMRPLVEQYFNWRLGLERSNHVAALVYLTARRMRKAIAEDGLPPRLRFHVDGDRVRVGGTDLTYAGMRSLLRAIRSGRGFYIEHMGAGGELEVPPPGRFVREVMVPTGYVNRTLSDKGLAALRERGG